MKLSGKYYCSIRLEMYQYLHILNIYFFGMGQDVPRLAQFQIFHHELSYFVSVCDKNGTSRGESHQIRCVKMVHHEENHIKYVA